MKEKMKTLKMAVNLMLCLGLCFCSMQALFLQAEEGDAALQQIYVSDYLVNNPDKLLSYVGHDPRDPENPMPGFDTAFDGEPICIAGETYAKGIGMHSYELSAGEETGLEIDIEGAGYTLFTATIGMNDYPWAQEVESNTAAFYVLVDEEVVYESDVMTYDAEPQQISINIAGASTLKLCVDPNETTYSDSALWGNALLINDPSVTPSAPTATPTPASTPTPSSTAEKTDAAVSTPTKVTVETPEQKTDLFPIIVCSIAAVAVAAVVIIVIVAKKKKK